MLNESPSRSTVAGMGKLDRACRREPGTGDENETVVVVVEKRKTFRTQLVSLGGRLWFVGPPVAVPNGC